MGKTGGTIVSLALRVLGIVFGEPSWAPWIAVLKGTFGLPLIADELELFCRVTGRARPPTRQVREAWFVIGRRSGKSMVAALIAIFCCCCRTYAFAPGEVGTFVVVAADRKQARTIRRYVGGLLKLSKPLGRLVVSETRDTIVFSNGVVLEIHTASFRSLRGYTIIGGACDEAAFWPSDDSANPDTEIFAALRPAMATIPDAILVCLTSPYSKSGETWKAFRDHFGRDSDEILVVNADSRTLNPTIPIAVIEQAYADDPAHASAEWGARFRSDLETYISENTVDGATGSGAERPPLSGIVYRAGFDGAGGSVAGGDSATLAIAHDEQGRTILDLVRDVKPPFSPEAVITDVFVPLLKQYGIGRVVGDRWAGEWPRAAFLKSGVVYDVCEQTKSDLYLALLPRINSGLVELRDIKALRVQLLGLERRTARGGKDSIDHRPGAHDDLINAAAIVLAQSTGVMMTEQEVARMMSIGAHNDDAPLDDVVLGDPDGGRVQFKRFCGKL